MIRSVYVVIFRRSAEILTATVAMLLAYVRTLFRYTAPQLICLINEETLRCDKKDVSWSRR